MSFLADVISYKKKEIAIAKRTISLAQLSMEAKSFRIRRRSFKKALRRKPIGLIAEIKLKSPSMGVLTKGNFRSLANLYSKSNASAVSVLTDRKYFNGELGYLMDARAICPQPILRKDFIIDAYQVYESVVRGADALLLIVAALPSKKLKELISLTRSFGIDALVEVHSKKELQKALEAGADIIGINNRNLKTLTTDIKTTETIMSYVPKKAKYTFVSESGIYSRKDVLQVKKSGVHAILVGSSIVTAKNRKAKLRELSLS